MKYVKQVVLPSLTFLGCTRNAGLFHMKHFKMQRKDHCTFSIKEENCIIDVIWLHFYLKYWDYLFFSDHYLYTFMYAHIYEFTVRYTVSIVCWHISSIAYFIIPGSVFVYLSSPSFSFFHFSLFPLSLTHLSVSLHLSFFLFLSFTLSPFLLNQPSWL